MESSHLIDYIKECVQRGYSLEEIHGYILSRGYDTLTTTNAFLAAGYYPPNNLQSSYKLPKEENQEVFYTSTTTQQRPDDSFYEDFDQHLTHLSQQPAHDKYWLSQQKQQEIIRKELPKPKELLNPAPIIETQEEQKKFISTASFLVIVQIILLLIILIAGGLLAFYYYQYI